MPKLAFLDSVILKNQYNVGNSTTKELLFAFPQYLSYNLEQSIAVRHAFLVFKAAAAATTSSSQMMMPQTHMEWDWNNASLREMLQTSDEVFVRGVPSILSKLTAKGSSPTTIFSGHNPTLSDEFNSFKTRFLNGGLAAAKDADSAMLALLLTHGWNPNHDDDRGGRSVLMWAAAQGGKAGGMAIVRLLVERAEMSPSHVANDGCTCMHFAVQGDNVAVCKYLALRGCDPLLCNSDGTTPLHWAVGSGSIPTVEWLIDECGADITHRNAFGCSVAHFACSGGQLHMCQYLQACHGVDFTVCNGHGHDGLTKAVAYKQNQVVRWLLYGREKEGDYQQGVLAGGGKDALERRMRTRELLTRPRPWDDGEKTLIEIAGIVGNAEGVELLKHILSENECGRAQELNIFRNIDDDLYKGHSTSRSTAPRSAADPGDRRVG